MVVDGTTLDLTIPGGSAAQTVNGNIIVRAPGLQTSKVFSFRD